MIYDLIEKITRIGARRRIKELNYIKNNVAFERNEQDNSINDVIYINKQGNIESLLNDQKLQKRLNKLKNNPNRGIELNIDYKDCVLIKSSVELLQKEPRQAIKTLENYLDKNPTDPEIYEELARIQKIAGDYEQQEKNKGIAQRMRTYEKK